MGALYVAGEVPTADKLNQYYGNADATPTTVTAASQTRLTTSYSIPAGEASAGSGYVINFGGSGTWGSTQQLISFTLVIGSTILFSGSMSLGAQAFAASAAFRFSGRAEFVVNTGGATGNVMGSFMINMTETANAVAPPGTYTQGNFQGQATYGLADSVTAASSAIDFTAANAVVVKCGWASATGSPTITNRSTIFQKVA
jgi:hypothetical protein